MGGLLRDIGVPAARIEAELAAMEHVFWIHDSYPWLNQLAKQAKTEQKHGK